MYLFERESDRMTENERERREREGEILHLLVHSPNGAAMTQPGRSQGPGVPPNGSYVFLTLLVVF